MIAWQRRIRDERAMLDRHNLFGEWWRDLDLDIGRATVQEITPQTAARVINEYEWMGCMPAIVLHCYGIYFDGALGGAVVYSPEYGENLGVWDAYGYTGKIILIARGACVHWAHPHAASKLIRGSMRLLPRRFEVVTATTDELAGEVGTVYQACGFLYVGRMRADNPRANTATRSGAALVGNKLYTGRTLRHILGTQKRDVVLATFPTARFIEQRSKGRYFAFRGDRRDQRRHREAIAHLIQPYPKRSLEVAA